MSFIQHPASAPSPDVGDLVHELNNAIAPILLSVELLRRRIGDPDAQRQLDLVAGHAWRGAAAAKRMQAWLDKGGARRPRRARRT